MTLTDLKQEFLNFCNLKNLSVETIKTYDCHIRYFINFVSDLEIENLNASLVCEYVLFVNSSSLSVMSKRSYLREVKTFLNFIDKKFDTALASNIYLPRKQRTIVHIFTDEEINTIYGCLKSLRDRLIFALAYDCGLRRIEITRIQLKDIYKGFIRVWGKGNKYRLVPYGEFTSDLIKSYLALEHKQQSDYLILTRYGKPFTVDGLSNFFRQLSSKSGIDLSAHQFRHNFATNFLIDQIEHGSSDLFQLQLLLGHADPEVTKTYLHLAHEQLLVKKSYSHLDKKRHLFQDTSTLEQGH